VASSQSHGTFTQTGWFTAVFGGSFVGRSGSVITPTSTETLFAQWALSTQTGKQALLVGAIGPFVVNSSALGATLKAQVRDIALGMRSKGYAVATTYGFSVPSERQLGKTLSARRAASVATYLRSVLASLHVKAVAMHSAGEGSVHGATKALNRRVEIFLTL
jgi:outer membrane protein OmpA-like peptidoglycan-associated protein